MKIRQVYEPVYKEVTRGLFSSQKGTTYNDIGEIKNSWIIDKSNSGALT